MEGAIHKFLTESAGEGDRVSPEMSELHKNASETASRG